MKNERFLSPDIWQSLYTGNEANCLGFAIGEAECIELPWEAISIEDSFRNTVKKYSVKVRKVDSITAGKYHFLVYGFYPMPYFDYYSFKTKYRPSDFHIVRIEPDGTWVHKPDAIEPPAVISEHDELTFGEYTETPHIFVLDEE